jgi:hypothetical protein
MGIASEPSPVKLLIGMLAREEMLFEKALAALEKEYGVADYASPVIPFTFTTYYDREMGSGLLRRFYAFKELINPEELASIKIFTNNIEAGYSLETPGGSKRQINLDPGYIALSKLVLASVKDRSHRVYIGRGIYAEITLQYEKKNFLPWHWTYPDFRSDEYKGILTAIRQVYLNQLKTIPGEE